MKRQPLRPSDYSYSMPDTMPMPAWNAAKNKTSTPKGLRKSVGTIKAKALLRRLGM